MITGKSWHVQVRGGLIIVNHDIPNLRRANLLKRLKQLFDDVPEEDYILTVTEDANGDYEVIKRDGSHCSTYQGHGLVSLSPVDKSRSPMPACFLEEFVGKRVRIKREPILQKEGND